LRRWRHPGHKRQNRAAQVFWEYFIGQVVDFARVMTSRKPSSARVLRIKGATEETVRYANVTAKKTCLAP
jgi:hypothetical protein